jgi:hypothetical protein
VGNGVEKVRAELLKYEHPLVEFAAGTGATGEVELLIHVRNASPEVHTYTAPVHPRDLEHPQFPWTFQKYLYDCLHDYLVELFIRTPQSRDQ